MWPVIALGFAAVFWGFVVVLYLSPRIRKSTFIAATYMTLTVWYYYRKWEKKHMATKPRRASNAQPMPMRRRSVASTASSESLHIESVHDSTEASVDVPPPSSVMSDRSPRNSECSSSGASASGEEPTKKMPKLKIGILRAFHRSSDEVSLKRSSESSTHSQSQSRVERRMSSPTMSEEDSMLPLSPGSSSPTRSTRRVFVGRKKPANWAD